MCLVNETYSLCDVRVIARLSDRAYFHASMKTHGTVDMLSEICLDWFCPSMLYFRDFSQ